MINPKKYSLYSPYESFILPFGWGIGFNAILIFVCIKMNGAGYESSVIIGLLLPLWILWLTVSISMVKSGLAYRLLAQISFDSSGVNCYFLGFPTHSISWTDIHTFGIYGYFVSYLQRELILFSMDKSEFAPKTIQEANFVSKSRIIIQYRESVWKEMQPYLPNDINKKLSAAIEKKQDCFHKR